MKKRILVVGMLTCQQRQIERHYGDRADLRFLDSSRLHKHTQSAALQADVVIVNTKFVSHSLSATVQKGTVVNFRGGMTKLKQVIDEQISGNP